MAGIGRADLTPPVGYPLFGYSATSKHLARGVQTRLYARALYLRDPAGRAVALVQCDLGAVSALLHRRVAERVAPYTDLGADRILIAATHTHAAPGGYFESPFHNKWGGREAGFDPGLFEFLSERIAEAVRTAYDNRAPAKVAVGRCVVEGVTYNRSLPAYQAHQHEQGQEPESVPSRAVNRHLTLLRVDRVTAEGTIPLGAFTNFAIHGTVVGPENDLYSADCHGAAERYLETAIRCHYGLGDSSEVIGALTNGPAGDVAPGFDRSHRGFEEAERLGRIIADSAFGLFRRLERALHDTLTVQHAYREIDLRHTIRSANGSELSPPRLGFPVLGGTEDGYSFLRSWWPGAEGSRAQSADGTVGGIAVSLLKGPFSWNGLDSAKVWAAGGLHDHLLPAYDFPEWMTLQVIRLGELLIVAVPGELTVNLGQEVAAACSSTVAMAKPVRYTLVSSLTNQYMSYFSTPAEYNAQHYEGAHTLWGPHSGNFLTDELAVLCHDLTAGEVSDLPDVWTFRPGPTFRYADYRPGSAAPVKAEGDLVIEIGPEETVTCHWWDEPPSRLRLDEINWRVEVPGAGTGSAWTTLRRPGLVAEGGLPVDGHGLDLSVMHCSTDELRSFRSEHLAGRDSQPDGKHLWCVRWSHPGTALPPRFRLALYVGAATVPSITREFTVSVPEG